jgi:hypothetical protein
MHKSRSELVTGVRGNGIELGVASGWFSDRILRLSNLNKLYSVDRWAGDRGHNFHQYSKALELLSPHGERSAVIKAEFREIVNLFDDGYFDFIFIDGYAHTGQESGKTLDDWWPKLRNGGIFSGHDYSEKRWPKTFHEVNKFLDRKNLKLSGVTEDKDPSWYLIKPPYEKPLPDILLIGNSPKALSENKGKEIDSFEGEVVRFNDALTTSYEDKLGSRTDVWATWGNRTTPNKDMEKAKKILFSVPFKLGKKYRDAWELLSDWEREVVDVESFYRAKHQIGHHPSSGAIAASHYIYKGQKVYIYGFSHFDKSFNHHYWSSNDTNADHSPEKERGWFSKKISQGLVHPL